MQTVLCFAREFGMTPTARARLDITQDNTSDVGSVIAYTKSKGH
jgi:phage terminase small subunit